MTNAEQIEELHDIMETHDHFGGRYTMPGSVVKENRVIPRLTKKAQKVYQSLPTYITTVLEYNAKDGNRNICKCSYFGIVYDESKTNIESYKDFGKKLSKVLTKYTVLGRMAPIISLKLASDGDRNPAYRDKLYAGIGKNRRMLLSYLFIEEFKHGAKKTDGSGFFLENETP